MINKYFHFLRSSASESYQKAILNFLEPSTSKVSFLDCGCDDGTWTLRLGNAIGDVRLHGIEIIKERREIARSKGINALEGNLNTPFPFGENTMDIVHANQVIEHLYDTDTFISEIMRVLKPGGYAVVCTENLASWHNIFSLLLGWQPFSLTNICCLKFQIGNPLAIHNQKPTQNPNSWQHLKVFSYRGLKELFQLHGMNVENYSGSGYYPFPCWLGKVDVRHAAFLIIKVRKPRC